MHESDLDLVVHDNNFLLGADYIFAPVNKMFSKKYEISAGAALSYSYFSIDSYYNNSFSSTKNNYDIWGANISLAADYYITRRFSLKVYGNYNAMQKFTVDDINYFSTAEDKTLSVRNIEANISNYNLGIGAVFHLIN